MFSIPSVLKRTQILPITLEEAWNFFSSPKNLKKITPEYMDFKVHTPVDELEHMYPGQMISYTVRPVMGIPIKWTTEITHVDTHKFFVDEQRVGPYTMWHHQHHFVAIDNGVKMTDIVHYMLPLGPLGWVVRKLFVKRQLEEIFDYRYKVVAELFGESHNVTA